MHTCWRWRAFLWLGWLMVLGLLQAAPLLAEPDSVRLDVLSTSRWEPRWENLEGAREWLHGPRPRKQDAHHWLHLAPGDSVLIALPARARLRALPAGADTLTLDDLDWQLGDGRGLMIEVEPRAFEQGLELHSQRAHPSVLRLSRPPQASGTQRLALFVLRVDAPPDHLRYRQRLELPGTARRVFDRQQGEQERYWPLEARERMELELNGPLRVRLDSRLRLLDDTVADVQDYRLSWQLDGGSTHHSRHLSVTDYRRDLHLDGQPVALGTVEHSYVEIPPGLHRLRLSTDAPLLVRALALDEPDDWLAQINEPPPLREALQRSRALSSCAQLGSAQRAQPPLLVQELMRHWCQAHEQARDTRYQPSALVAAAQLGALAHAYPQLPELDTAQQRLSGRYGFYRSLLPDQPLPALRALAFPAPRLLHPGESRRLWLDARQHPGLAERLPNAMFTRLDDTALQYVLPERAHDGRLRLALAGRGALWLQLDEDAPRRIESTAFLPQAHFQRDPVTESLSSLTGQTLSAPLSTRLGARSLAQVGVIELPLAASVSRLRLWRAEASGADALWVALAYRAAKPYVPAERTYIDVLDRLTAAGVISPKGLVNTAPSDVARDEADTDDTGLLWAHLWRPLQRWVSARARRFAHGLANDEDAQHVSVALGKQLLERGELYLGERLLRALVLRGEASAAERLEKLYRDNADLDASATLAAVRVVQQPNWAHLAALTTSLAELAQDREAVQLGMLLDQAGRLTPELREAVLWSAVALGWERAQTQLASTLTPDEQRIWRGHLAAWQGRWTQALEEYEHAGALAQARALKAALAVRADLEHTSAEVRADALQRWARSQAAGVGPMRWRAAPWLAVSSAGAVWLENRALHQLQSYWRATPQQPLTVHLSGPARLRVSVRLLHAADEERLEDWLLITNAAGTRRVALETSRPVSGVRLIGQGGASAGLQQEVVLEVAPGEHAITFSSRHAPMLLAVDLHQPLIPWLGALTGAARALVYAGEWGDPLHIEPMADRAAPRQAAQSPVAVVGMSAARARMTQWLWRWEHEGVVTDATLVAASELMQTHRDDARLIALGQRLLRQTEWSPLETLEGGAGLTYPPASELPAISPTLRTRLALSAAFEPDERILSGSRALLINLDQPEARALHLRLQLDGPEFLTLEPTEVEIRLDEQPSRRVRLDARAPDHQLDLTLAAGVHQLRIQALRPVTNQFIRVRLLEGDARTPVLEPPRYAYHVATRDQPLLAHVHAPAWIRLDEWRDGELISEERAINASGWHTLQLRPEAGRSERLLRLMVLTRAQAQAQAAPRTMSPSGAALERNPAIWSQVAQPSEQREHLAARWPPHPGDEDGTWSATLGWMQRAGLEDEDGGSDARRDSALETRLSYRELFEESSRWWRFDLFNRWREHDAATLGLHAELYQQGREWPLNWQLELDSYAQWFDTGLEWSATLSASLSHRWTLSPKSVYVQRLTGFARALSRDQALPGKRLDLDVYSDYKRDHSHGLRWSHRFIQRPWRDAEWELAAVLATNEWPLTLDRTTLSASWHQRVQDLHLTGALRWIHRYADEERAEATETYRLRLGLEYSGLRKSWGHAVVALFLDQNLEQQQDRSIGLNIRWQATGRRGLRDFKPGSVRFRDWKEWRLRE